MIKAKKSDWKTLEMPEETETLQLDVQLTEAEYAALQSGHIPQEMVDK